MNSSLDLISFAKKIAITLTFSLYPFQVANSIEHSAINMKEEIDAHIERLGKNLESKKHSQACIEAQSASNLIMHNIKKLRRLEPYYNWPEIKGSLKKVMHKYCE